MTYNIDEYTEEDKVYVDCELICEKETEYDLKLDFAVIFGPYDEEEWLYPNNLGVLTPWDCGGSFKNMLDEEDREKYTEDIDEVFNSDCIINQRIWDTDEGESFNTFVEGWKIKINYKEKLEDE